MHIFTYDYDDETLPRPRLGFDLCGVLAVYVSRCGFTLAILPRWLLALEVSFSRHGLGLAGVVLGRGFISLGELEHSRWDWWKDDSSRHLRLGHLELILDRKSWELHRATRTVEASQIG